MFAYTYKNRFGRFDVLVILNGTEIKRNERKKKKNESVIRHAEKKK